MFHRHPISIGKAVSNLFPVGNSVDNPIDFLHVSCSVKGTSSEQREELLILSMSQIDRLS